MNLATAPPVRRPVIIDGKIIKLVHLSVNKTGRRGKCLRMFEKKCSIPCDVCNACYHVRPSRPVVCIVLLS